MAKNKANRQLTILFLISLSISAVIAQEHGKGPGQGRGRGPRPTLTEEQKTCLDGKIGVPGGEKPTRESMAAAFAECGVEKPKGPTPGNGERPQKNQKQEQAAITQSEAE